MNVRDFSVLVISTVCISCTAAHQPAPSRADYEAGYRFVLAKLQQAREGDVDPAFATFLMVQTQLSIQNGNYRAAVRTAEPLAELIEIVHGPNSLETADALEVLASIYCNVDRCAESPALLERAAQIRSSQQQPDGT